MGFDQELAGVAENQHGAFTLAQARAIGAGPECVKHRLRTGRWECLSYPEVYRLPGTARTWEQGLMALVLAAGPGAAASHRSAAALLGIPGFPRQTIEVTTPRPWRRRALHAQVHSSRKLPADHLTAVDGIPTTKPARTLVDLAAVVHPRRCERAVDNCLAAQAVTLEDLLATTAELAKRGRTGISLMRAILATRGTGYVAPASELEARFLEVVRAAGLVEPVRQLEVGDDEARVGRVDFAYPWARVLIELDSRRHHSAKLDLEADRARDNRLVAGGWRVVRVTWEQLHRQPADVVALVRKLAA